MLRAETWEIEMLSIIPWWGKENVARGRWGWDGFKFQICKVGKSLSSRILTSATTVITSPLLHKSLKMDTFQHFPRNNDVRICSLMARKWYSWYFYISLSLLSAETFHFQEPLPVFVSLTLSEHPPSCSRYVNKISDIEFLNSLSVLLLQRPNTIQNIFTIYAQNPKSSMPWKHTHNIILLIS